MAQEPGKRPEFDETDRRDEDVVGKAPLTDEESDEFEEIDDIEDADEETEER